MSAAIDALHIGALIELQRTIQLLQPNAVLNDGDLMQVRAAGRLPAAGTHDLAGHRLDDLIARIHAEIQLPAGVEQPDQRIILAAPYF